MLSVRTPLKLSLLGGGSDYPAWFEVYGGCILGATIDIFSEWSLSSTQLPLSSDESYLIKELKNFTGLELPQNQSLNTNSSTHIKKGTGASSASIISLLNLLYEANEVTLTREETANRAIEFEQKYLKKNVGSQDQILSTFGGINKVIFNTDGSYNVQKVNISNEAIDNLNNHLLLIDTNEEYAQRREISSNFTTCTNRYEDHINELMQLAHYGSDIITDMKGLKELGKLLSNAWKIKKELSPNMSSNTIDELYNRLLELGVYGGKLLGAGGGGYIAIIAPKHIQKAISNKIPNINIQNINISQTGYIIKK